MTQISRTQGEPLESVAADIDAAASDQHSAAATVRSIAADRRRGVSWKQISTRRVGWLFGVSHQRISSIVAHRDPEPPDR